jgi:hypothetical protein
MRYHMKFRFWFEDDHAANAGAVTAAAGGRCRVPGVGGVPMRVLDFRQQKANRGPL